MSRSLFHLCRALSNGRISRLKPRSREEILHALLGMRAAAARAGLTEMESQLRSQIRWALPIHASVASPEVADEEAEAGGSHPPLSRPSCE